MSLIIRHIILTYSYGYHEQLKQMLCLIIEWQIMKIFSLSFVIILNILCVRNISTIDTLWDDQHEESHAWLIPCNPNLSLAQLT